MITATAPTALSSTGAACNSEPPPVPWGGSFWATWAEGYRFVAGFAPARAMLALVAILSWTISPYSALMPVYAKDIYGGGPHTLGFLLAAAGAGALASTLYLASRVTVRGLGIVIAVAAIACGGALVAFAYLSIFPLALTLLFVIGGGVILAAASVSTILQTIVPDRLRGRVAGFFSLVWETWFASGLERRRAAAAPTVRNANCLRVEKGKAS